MPRSNRTKKRRLAANLGNTSDIKQQVSSFLKKADDCPIPRKRSCLSSSDGDSEKPKISDEDIQKRKEYTKLRKKRALEYPKLFLDTSFKDNKDATLCSKILSMKDIQTLALHSLLGVHDTQPSWCELVRPGKVTKVVVVILHGVSETCYQANKECFIHIDKHHDVSALVNEETNQTLVDAMFYRSMSKTRWKYQKLVERLDKKDKDDNKQDQSKKGKKSSKDIKKETDNIDGVAAEPTNGEVEADIGVKSRTKSKPDKMSNFPGRTHYMLSQDDLERLNFPKPEEHRVKSTNHGDEVTDSSPMIGLDCEMCTTTKGTELTRVSLVNEDGETIYNSLVKPKNPIIDYATRYSGITKKLLDPVTTRLKDVQKHIIALLPYNAILVGQSIENDLRALKLYHPHIIDTCRLFTVYPVALKKLTKFYLSRTIQDSLSGHDSIEDAQAALDLAKLKVEKGDSLPGYMNAYKPYVPRLPSESIFQKTGSDKVFMMVDCDTVLRRLYKESVGSIPTSNDTETRKKAINAIESSHFLWAQFHSYRTYLEGTTQDNQEQKKLLTKLNSSVKKIYNACPEKTLMITLMLENTRGPLGSSNKTCLGRVFAGIKMTPSSIPQW